MSPPTANAPFAGTISVVVSTYARPRELALVLEGYARQDDPDFEVVVADDGSGEATARVVEEAAARTGLRVTHVWHADRGFGKTEILDRALLEAAGDYLVFTDGDCLPRRDFVATHRALARPGRFLSGGYVRLPRALADALEPADVREGRVWDGRWLLARGFRPGRHVLRMLRPGTLPLLLDALTPTKATWNGMNASTWKTALVEANGFDLRLRYGSEDRELGARLENAGLRGRQIRHRAVLLHLEHDRPWRDDAVVERQRAYRREVARSGATRTDRGLAELPDDVPTRVTRLGGGAAS